MNVQEQLNNVFVRYFFDNVRTQDSGFSSANEQFNVWFKFLSEDAKKEIEAKHG
jgi:hypothetical protein